MNFDWALFVEDNQNNRYLLGINATTKEKKKISDRKLDTVCPAGIPRNKQRLGSAFDDLDPRLFATLVMMLSTPAKSAGDASYASQDPFVDRSTVMSPTISTPICIRSTFFLRRTQQL